jgi:predicted metal-binding membrane protein
MTDSADDLDFSHLPPVSARLANTVGRPRILAGACVVVLAGLGWLYLGVMVWAMPQGDIGALGPWLATAICRPTLGTATLPGMASGTWDLAASALVLLMWCAMVLAMMLPSAGPMILTYAQIADTAARKAEPVVLAAGYLAVWLGFALVATVLQGALAAAGVVDPAMSSVSGLFSGAVLLGAGLYQFSPLKHACLTACQRPFPFFFAHWTTLPGKLFRLGLRQGLYCLGCCWAMMLVMFAVGLMNVAWMAGLALVMTVEKITITTRFSRIIGAILVTVGMVFVVTSVLAHWPVRAG